MDKPKAILMFYV